MRQLRKQEIKKKFKKFKREKEIVLLLEDLQYARNVASMFRCADAAGVSKVILTGITEQPPFGSKLKRASRAKEKSVHWTYEKTSGKAIQKLKNQGFMIIAIELADDSVDYTELPYLLRAEDKVCFIAGNEAHGVKKTTLQRVDAAVHIPMYGKGASLNVMVSTSIVLFGF